jgi:hypothetical protein
VQLEHCQVILRCLDHGFQPRGFALPVPVRAFLHAEDRPQSFEIDLARNV